MDEIRSVMTIQMKAAEQYFPVVLSIMLCKVVLTFEPVDEIQTATVKPVYNGPVYSGHPVYNGH